MEVILSLYFSVLKQDFFKNKDYIHSFFQLHHFQTQISQIIPVNSLMRSYILNVSNDEEDLI